MQNHLLPADAGEIRSIGLDVRFSSEFYVRVRLERGTNRVSVAYFVRNGDSAESGEGGCTEDAFRCIADGLACVHAGNGGEASTGFESRLSINDELTAGRLQSGELKRLLATVAAQIEDLAFLEDLPL